MDNLGTNTPQNRDDLDKPIPFDNGPDAPAPAKANPPSGAPAVSRAPLNLGGAGAGPAATTPAAPPGPATPRPAPRVQQPQIPVRRPVTAAPVGRITGCKTFFTKLHPGAIEFLDEQITGWLKENPGIVIRHTNVTTGEVQAKKTEPNIIITVWY
jgi:hypothetical protein